MRINIANIFCRNPGALNSEPHRHGRACSIFGRGRNMMGIIGSPVADVDLGGRRRTKKIVAQNLDQHPVAVVRILDGIVQESGERRRGRDPFRR